MRKSTCETYYNNIFKDCKTDTKSLYHSINKITGNTNDKIYPSFMSTGKVADLMVDFYNEKVFTIRNEISSNKSLTIKHKTNSKTNLNDLPANSLLLPETDSINTLSEFSEATPNMLLDIIMTLPNKSSMNDPMPVMLVKKFIGILLPILFHIITKSLKDGVFQKI